MRVALVSRQHSVHVAETDIEPGFVPGQGERQYAVCGARFTSVHTPSLIWSWNRRRINCGKCVEWLLGRLDDVHFSRRL